MKYYFFLIIFIHSTFFKKKILSLNKEVKIKIRDPSYLRKVFCSRKGLELPKLKKSIIFLIKK